MNDAVNLTEEIRKGMKENVLDYFGTPRFFATLIIAGIIVALIVATVKLAKLGEHRLHKNEEDQKIASQRSTFLHVMTSIVRGVVIVFGIILILQVNGVNVSSLIAGLSIVSAVVGLALTDAIKDVISGVRILSDHYFAVGDVIRYKDEVGEVIKMTIRSTKIRSIITSNIITISNKNFDDAVKVSDMFDIDLPLSYDEDPRTVHEILGAVAKKIGKIKGVSSCVYKGTQEFAESAIIYKIRYFCDPRKMPDIRREAIKIIQDTLGEKNIKIPYNKMDVYLKGTVQSEEEA